VLARRHRFALQLQRWISRVNSPWFIGFFYFLLQVWAGYSCPDLKQFRKRVRDLLNQAGDRPLIICANHLTMIDSMIINWLMFGYVDYLRHWRLMPWNMPEIRNFAANIPLRIMCYLGKSLYVERGGTLAQRRLTVEKFRQLLEWRELICIFPEGTRSRTGRIRGSPPTYSVGELCQLLPEAQVLCVYVRGYGQQTWGHVPKRGERFAIEIDLMVPATPHSGRRGAKDIAIQIMEKLGTMEDHFWTQFPTYSETNTVPLDPVAATAIPPEPAAGLAIPSAPAAATATATNPPS